MGKHEEKSCPRCSAAFECRPGDICHCQCYDTPLTVEEKAFIEDRYNDCLCRDCLLELRQRYIFFREKYLLYEK